MTLSFLYGREMQTCEIIGDHPQGEECLSKTEYKSEEQETTVIHAL
jgi:hypothetical protein